MAELPDYPFVNQLNSPTLDHRPDENKWFNCVICSILSAILYFRPELRGKLTPDSIKDAVLGENYANKGTDAAWFVDFCAHYGLKLYPVEGIPGHLVEVSHQLIQNGKPAIFTEIDPYVDTRLPQYAGWTHVCSFFKEIPNGLSAMDPFGGKLIEKSDGYWTEQLVGNKIWTMELIGGDEVLSIDLNVPEVSAHFKQQNAQSWVCLQTGKAVHDAMLTFYRTFGRNDCCGLTYLGLPVSNEISLGGGMTKQHFERGVLVYDPQRKIDNPTKSSGSVYLAHLYEGPGVDPKVAELQKQLTDAQSATQNSASLDTVKKIKALVAPF